MVGEMGGGMVLSLCLKSGWQSMLMVKVTVKVKVDGEFEDKVRNPAHNQPQIEMGGWCCTAVNGVISNVA